MNKRQRIKKNKEFSKVFQEGRSVANRQFVLYVWKKKEQQYFRLGLSVSKRVGNAVTRNRVKRYIREVFHANRDRIVSHADYVVIARKPTAEMDLFQVEKSLLHVMRKARILKKHVNEKKD